MRRVRSNCSLTLIALGLALAAPARADLGDEQYAVYTAFLQQVDWTRSKADAHTVERYVLRETTKWGLGAPAAAPERRRGQRPEAELDLSMVTSFVERNCTKERLHSSRFRGAEVQILSEREFQGLFWTRHEAAWTFDGRKFRRTAGDGWDFFDKKYRGAQGLLTVSRVGFSDDGRQAILYYENQVHDTGQGSFVLFEKTSEGWTIRKHVGSSVSWT